MNPIQFIIEQAYSVSGNPNSARIKDKLLNMLPLTILAQGYSLAESLKAVHSGVDEQNSLQRLRVVLPDNELVTKVMQQALAMKKIAVFKDYANSELGKNAADNIVKTLVCDESIESLALLAEIAPERAREKLTTLLLGAVQKQIQEQEGFELDSPLSEITNKLEDFDPEIFGWLRGSVNGPQFTTLGHSEKVPEPYKSLFSVIGKLEDCLNDEITLERFNDIVLRIGGDLKYLGRTAENNLILSAYRQIAAEFFLAVALKVEPLFAYQEVNTHNSEEFTKFNNLKDAIQKAAHLLGTEIVVDRDMQTENDAFVAAFLGMGFSAENVSAWLANPPEDQLLFTLWVTEEKNSRILEGSIGELYSRFKKVSDSSPNLDLLAEQGFLFINEPSSESIKLWASETPNLDAFLLWHMQNANTGNITPGTFTLEEYYSLFRAL